MSFQLPEQYLRTDFSWGPPAEEMTIDGRPFALYFKSDALQAVEWMRNFEDDNREEDEDEKYESRANAKVPDFKEVRDEERLNALRSQRAKQDKLAGIMRRPKNNAQGQNQRDSRGRGRGRGRDMPKRRQVLDIKSAVRLEPNPYAKFAQNDLARNTAAVPAYTDLASYGKPFIYNATQDAATPAKPVTLGADLLKAADLAKSARATTMADPRLREFVSKESDKYPCVVMTDEVMAMLMTSAASVYPWHLIVKKMPTRPIYFIGKDEASLADMQWVSETTPLDVRPSDSDPMVSERATSLGKESTLVHERFIRSSCTSRVADVHVDKGYPFPNTHTRMYRYRRFTMHPDSPNRYDIIVRTEIDAVTPSKESVRVFGLLEHRPQTGPNADVTDPRRLQSDWALNLNNHKATYTPIEFRKNQFKMSRWIALSAISGAKHIKIGFITRDDREKEVGTRHQLLHVHSSTPTILAQQLGIALPSMWGTLDMLLEAMIGVEDLSDAVFAKQSGEYTVLLGQVVTDSNDDGDDDDDDDDDEEEDEEYDEDDE